MNRKQFILGGVLLGLMTFLAGCSLFAPSEPPLTQLDISTGFVLSTTPALSNDPNYDCGEAENPRLNISHPKFGAFSLPLGDIWQDICDGSYPLPGEIIKHVYRIGDRLIIPLVDGRAGQLLTYTTYVYNIKEKKVSKLQNCIPMRDAELLSGGLVKGIALYDAGDSKRRPDAHYHKELASYCDLNDWTSYNAMSILSREFGTGEISQDQATEYIKAFFTMIEDYDLSVAYDMSLWQGAKKESNPFWDWYADAYKVDVNSVVALGNNQFDVQMDIYYSDEPIYDKTDPKQLALATKKSYQSKKEILNLDGKWYLNHLESKDITPEWICDKKIGEYEYMDGVGCTDECERLEELEKDIKKAKPAVLKDENFLFLDISDGSTGKTKDGKHEWRFMNAEKCKFVFDGIPFSKLPNVDNGLFETCFGQTYQLNYNPSNEKLYLVLDYGRSKTGKHDFPIMQVKECRKTGM